MSKYEDFEIVVERVGDAEIYAVNVRQPCGGNVGDASSSFSMVEIKTLGGSQNNTADIDPDAASRNFKIVSGGKENEYSLSFSAALSETAAKDVGVKLSQAIFKNDVLERLGECKAYCKAQKASLRIRLDLSRSAELAVLPWEYLRSTDNSNFVCLDIDTTLVRYLQTSNAIGPLKVIPPLRILVMAATPNDLPQLAKNDEIQNIRKGLEAFSQLEEAVEIQVLPKATMSALESALKKAQDDDEPYHVFHFIGHGAFDKDKQEGVLLLEDEQGKGVAYGHEDLGRLFQQFRSDLRLIVLNACEGARLSTTDSYSSVATKIMQIAETPAIIAMQFSITDSAAIIFAKSFYGQLASGENLEVAVDAARMAVTKPDEYQTLGKSVPVDKEWATPVFYLTANSGHLFDIKIPMPPEDLDAHYAAIKQLLPTCNLVVFLGLDVNLLNRPFYDSWKPGKGLPSAAELCSYLSGQLHFSPARHSLAGLAQQLRLSGRVLTDEFSPIFGASNKSSKLYEVFANLTKKITDQLPEEAPDPCHCSLLFVTTTYDFALENAFMEAGIGDFNAVCYNQDDEGNWFFLHSIYKDKKLLSNTPLVPPNAPNEYKGLRNKWPVILKLSGEVKSDSAFAITEDDFFAFAHRGLSELLPADLLGQINTSRHLYLGYDLQSWTLRLLWNRICENQGQKKKESSYAVVFHERDDPNARFWHENGVGFATASLDDYVAGLEKYVRNQL